MDAKTAYDNWVKSHLVNMRVYTNEEMFELGYNTNQTMVNAMIVIVEEQDKEIKKLTSEIKKLKKEKKND